MLETYNVISSVDMAYTRKLLALTFSDGTPKAYKGAIPVQKMSHVHKARAKNYFNPNMPFSVKNEGKWY